MNLPRITVITPSLNQVRFIERAICSVLDQGYENLEFIVMDGGSTDGTIETIRLYETELAHWVSQPDLGPGDAINQALGRATGRIVAMLNADDLMMPGALHAVAAAMTGKDAATWLVGHCLRVGESDQMLGRLSAAAPESALSFLMHDTGVLPIGSSFFSRELLASVGGFDRRLHFAGDYEIACRLLLNGHRPRVLPQTLSARREYHHCRTAVNTLRRGIEHIEAARSHAERLPLRQRYALWRNCDDRERIYTLAQAELHGQTSRRFLLERVLRHPWWMAHETLRRALIHGVARPARTAA